jgi:hypothetical protein
MWVVVHKEKCEAPVPNANYQRPYWAKKCNHFEMGASSRLVVFVRTESYTKGWIRKFAFHSDQAGLLKLSVYVKEKHNTKQSALSMAKKSKKWVIGVT